MALMFICVAYCADDHNFTMPTATGRILLGCISAIASA